MPKLHGRDAEKKWRELTGSSGGTGTPGADGYSPTAKVEQTGDGAVITITDKFGTTLAVVTNGKDGADGQPGKDGSDGKDGTSITVTKITESEEDGGENVVTFSDGTRITIKNGSEGSPGKDGADGGTPEMTVLRVDSSDGVGRGYAIVTFTLGEEQKSFTVYDGSAGYPGKDGADGDPGRGITSITRTSGTGAAGTMDTYTIKYTDNTTSTFAVYNGKDGTPYVLTSADKTEIAQEAAGLVSVPVDSVNGKTGAVTLGAADVGAATAEQFEQLLKEIADLGKVLTLTSDELANMTSDELAEEYSKGVRIVIVSDEYENLVPTAVSENGGVYNGCGYMNGIRLNSSGGITQTRQGCTTGYMQFIPGKKLYIYGSKSPLGTAGNYVATYDADFKLIGVNYMESLSGIAEKTDEKNLYTFEANTTQTMFNGASYIRVSLNPCEGKDVIVRFGGEVA